MRGSFVCLEGTFGTQTCYFCNYVTQAMEFLPKFTSVTRPNIWKVNCKRIGSSDVALEISDHQSSAAGASGISYGE